MLRGAGYKAVPLPSLGTPVDGRYQRALLSFKHAAERAGLGRIGHSSLLITDEFGPRLRLACLVTDAPLGSTARGCPTPAPAARRLHARLPGRGARPAGGRRALQDEPVRVLRLPGWVRNVQYLPRQMFASLTDKFTRRLLDTLEKRHL